LAYYWLGDMYLNDIVGKKIRHSILSDVEDEQDLYGTIGVVSSVNIFDFWKDDKSSHLAYIDIKNGKICIIIRIFDIFFGSVVVSENPTIYPKIISNFITLDPITKTLKQDTIENELKKLHDKIVRQEANNLGR
jgi:hypothetical protein